MAQAMTKLSRDEGWRWVDWREALEGDPRWAADARVFLILISERHDLEALEPYRDRLKHLKVVAVVLAPHEELLLAVQSFSPCFIAVSEADDAAVPEVLKGLSRQAWVCPVRGCPGQRIFQPRRSVP